MRTEQKSNIKSNIGRLLFVFLSLVLQVSWFVLLFLRLSEYSAYFTLFYSFLTFVIVIKIYGRPMNAAFKMPWIIIIMTFPILGICIYFLFGRGGVSPRIKKKFADIEKLFAVYTKQDDSVMCELGDIDPYMANQSRYLWNCCSGYPVYKNTDIEYYKDATDGFEAQLRELEKAEKFIFMEYHAIEDAEAFERLEKVLVRRAKEGVEVRLFYDDMGSIAFVDKDFIKRLKNEGIECRVFNPVKAFFNLFMNNRDHRKITVIDNRVGFTGGYNLADEYFNITHPYGYWKDTGIRLEGEAVTSLTRMFLEMWNGMKKTDTDYEKYFVRYGEYKSAENGFVQPYADSPLDNEKVGENVYLNLINYATDRIYITTPYLIISDEMTRTLTLAAKRGVDVRIITPGIPDKKIVYKMTRSYYAGLAEAGVRIYEYTPGFLHAKQFMCDGRAAAIGTINMDYRSLYHHFENGVLLYGFEAIKDMEADFSEMFEVSEEVTEKYAGEKSMMLKLGQCILRLAAPLL